MKLRQFGVNAVSMQLVGEDSIQSNPNYFPHRCGCAVGAQSAIAASDAADDEYVSQSKPLHFSRYQLKPEQWANSEVCALESEYPPNKLD